MSFSFEDLPDEILMIIFQYSCDTISTFLGLNQRLNNILIDRRLHLFTHFLHTKINDDYYNSEIFQQVSQQLLSINKTIDEKTLSEILQPLISYQIRQKYIQLGDELHSSIEKIKAIREKLTNEEFLKLNEELKTQFMTLNHNRLTINYVKSIKSLVLTKGARLECDDAPLAEYNLTRSICCNYLGNIYEPKYRLYLEFYKTLIISNPLLVKNQRYYYLYSSCNLQIFIFDALFKVGRVYKSGYRRELLDRHCYGALTDFCLFVLQSWKEMPDNENDIEGNMYGAFELLPDINQNIFIRTTQFEIMKIVIDEFALKNGCQQWDDYSDHSFTRQLTRLMKKKQIDIIKYLHYYFKDQNCFVDKDHIRQYVNLLIENQSERQFFSTIMDYKSSNLMFPKKDLLFILLERKKRKLFEKLIKLYPNLIHELDEDGNDPLLYICLKVSGLRHRIVESLIKAGSDLQRRNSQGQNFMDTLQLQRNKNLLQKLYEHEII